MSNSRALSWLWIASGAVLGLTGTAQMPLYKRYYLADIPGLGWLADFSVTHTVHYLAAAVFLFLAAWWVGRFVFARGWRLTPTGRVRVVAVAALVATGIVRMAKNDPGVWYGPGLVMFVDWAHLGAAMLFGGAAWAAWRRKEPYSSRKV